MRVKHNFRGLFVGLGIAAVVGLVLNAGLFYVKLNPQQVHDQLVVWKFLPTASIGEQVKRDGMTSEGRFLYLASQPRVLSRRDFNQICSAVSIDTGNLGCYIDSTKRIYLLHETDKRVDGTEEVMAAHEMLRAAWDRMSTAQRAPLLVQLNHVLYINDDPNIDLSDAISTDRSQDPHDSNGELYATIGTEVPSVGKVLEASYAKYFVKRSTVTALYVHANSYIIALRHKVDTLTSAMTKLNNSITSSVKSFKSAVSTWQSNVASFNARASTPGGFSSEGAFNAARGALVARENSLKREASQINAEIDTFNTDLTTLKGYAKIALSLAISLNIDFSPIEPVTTA
jgi:hypothetical protein